MTLPPPSPLLTPRGLLFGGWSCLLAAAAFVAAVLQRLHEPTLDALFNDLYDFWAAARVVNPGGSPYDKHLVWNLTPLSVVLVHAGREGRRQCGTLAGLLARQALACPGAELVEHAA